MRADVLRAGGVLRPPRLQPADHATAHVPFEFRGRRRLPRAFAFHPGNRAPGGCLSAALSLDGRGGCRLRRPLPGIFLCFSATHPNDD